MESWVTLATNDSYSVGALTLAASLRRANTSRNLSILVTSQVTPAMRHNLNKAFDQVVTVEPLDSKDETNLKLLCRPELGVTLTKLHCWTLTQFSKCVFLDADTLVVANCDDLFDREEFSAAPDAGWPDCFNSGVFVFRPNVDTFKSILKFAATHGSFDGGDQGLLNQFFSSWATEDISKHLPFLYNMVASSTYTYLPAFKQYGAGVKIVHFIGSTKPWQVDRTRPHHPLHNTEHLRLWWSIYEEDVKTRMVEGGGGGVEVLAGAALGGITKEVPVDSREQWEHGNPDYGGTAAFENIVKKIGDTMNVSQPEKSRTASKPDVASREKQ